MRVIVLGGTMFIGRRIVEELVARGDEVMVVHRGQHCPADWVEVEHLHGERAAFSQLRGAIAAFGPNAAVDSFALTAGDAQAGLAALPSVPTVVLSSQDVYRAFEALNAGGFAAPVPLTEASELRHDRYPYRDAGLPADREQYSKLDVEDRYVAAGAVVLRLPVVYGPHDGQRREWPVLRRVLAGRTRVPIGAGNLLLARTHVDDVAAAAVCALDALVAGRLEPGNRIFNLAESAAYPISAWWSQIAQAAGAELEFVQVPDAVLPPDLGLGARFPQHIVTDCTRAARLLGWQAGDPLERVAQSVAWHLAHAPQLDWTEADTRADDAALAAAVG